MKIQCAATTEQLTLIALEREHNTNNRDRRKGGTVASLVNAAAYTGRHAIEGPILANTALPFWSV